MFDAVAKNTLVPLILRLGIAVVFIYHGLHKVTDDGTQMGSAWMEAKNMKPEDVRPPAVQAAVAWGELIGGIALALGFVTRLAALGIAAIMAGAMYTTTFKNGFEVLKFGYEYNVVIIVICLALVLMGGGTLSLDRIIRIRRRRMLG
jgi:putative oxidoreductase